MSSTFLSLTNRVLNRLNEVTLNSDNFDTAKGVHAATREAVSDTVLEINKHYFQWPFNSEDGSQLLVVGQQEYSWPASFKNVDWESFQLQKDDGLGVSHTKLKPIDRQEWYFKYRDTDQDAGVSGIAAPMFVFDAHGSKFGVSPSPDQAYTVEFKYYSEPAALVLPTDTTTIPREYEYVIVDGAMRHMNLFKENAEASMMVDKRFKDGLDQMRRLLIKVEDYMRDTRIRF